MGLQETFAAEAAAIAQFQAGKTGKRNVLGIRVPAHYAAYKTAGIDVTKMLSTPQCILLSPKADAQYLWKKPDDSYTKAMVKRGLLRPVLASEVDKDSPYANVDTVKLITANGPREVVRTPGGLGLFECPTSEAMSAMDRASLPGEHWDAKYLQDLDEQSEQWEADVEHLSQSSVNGRIRLQEKLAPKDTQSEMIG